MNIKQGIIKLRPMILTWLVVFGLYCGTMLLEGLFWGGDLYVSVVTLIAGVGLLLNLIILLLIFPHAFYVPLYIAIASQLVFIFVGSYLRELDFYFFVMLMIVGIVSTLKNFKQLAWCVSLMTAINILMLLFYVPHLEWLNNYRFFMNFTLFIYGSAFMLIQTYNVATKESRSERALLAFLSFLHNTPNFIIITDSKTRVRYISNSLLASTHVLHREFAEGQPLIDLFGDKVLKLMFSGILKAEGFYETVIKINVENKDKYFKVITDKLSDISGDRFIDITDITLMEENRIAAEVANKAKSNFLATMSHEIRTPMNAIIGIAQIRMQTEGLPDEYMLDFEKIYNSGSNLLGIINDILDMSKIETGKLEVFAAEYDVPSFINDAVQMNVIRIGSKPIEFILDVDENLPIKLIGDELRLKQILNNLLSNAIKYTESGYVKLSVSHSEEEDGNVALHFVVEDTGQGMKLEDRDKFFSEYSRFNTEENRETEGTGLGLSITKKLIEMMDGTIWAESEYGNGSVFLVTVKQGSVACDAIGAELAGQLCSFAFAGERQLTQIIRSPMPYGSVLVVDDVETNLYVAEGLMKPYQLSIETVTDGFKAIERVENGKSYDVIFMDHMMPQIDGIETTRRLRAFGYTGVIVALTANALTGNDEMFRQNGFDGFIPKPIDIRELNAALNKYIRDRHPEEAEKYKSEEVTQDDTLETVKHDELAAFFVKDAKKAAQVIEEIYLRIDMPDTDLRPYEINVHAMKSALANIGEKDISALAGILERAAKENDKAVIKNETQGFLDALRKIIEKNDTQPVADDGATDSDPVLLREKLTLFINACDEYDDQAAEAVLSELKKKPWSKETKELLDTLAELVLHSEFEDAAAGAAKLT